MMTRSAPKYLLAVALALILSACGGSDDTGTSSTADVSSSPSVSASPTEPEASADPGDAAAAEAALLRLADMPVGWESSPREDDDDDDGSQDELAACMGGEGPFTEDPSVAKAESPTFSSSDDDEIESAVRVNRDEETAIASFEALRTNEFADCMRQLVAGLGDDISGSGDESVTVGEPTFNEITLGAHGDETLAFRVTVPASVEGFDFEFALNATYTRVGRAIAHLTATQAPFGSLSDEQIVEVLETAAQRLADAVAASS